MFELLRRQPLPVGQFARQGKQQRRQGRILLQLLDQRRLVHQNW